MDDVTKGTIPEISTERILPLNNLHKIGGRIIYHPLSYACFPGVLYKRFAFTREGGDIGLFITLVPKVLK